MKTLTDPVLQLFRGRLWPVAVLLLVAAAAAPLVLADREELPPAVSATPATGVQALQAAIVNASQGDPGERRRVLGASKDPFAPSGKQPRARRSTPATSSGGSATTTSTASASALAGAGATGGASTVSGAGTGLPATPFSGGGGSMGGTPGGGTPGGGSPAGGGAPAPAVPGPISGPVTPKPKGPALFSLRVSVNGGEPLSLERLQPVPTDGAPSVIYLGVLEDGKTAVFLLDAGVKADGDGSCHPSPDDCQRVYLKKGETEFFDIENEAGGSSQVQVDLLAINARKAAKATVARASMARKATSGRALLRERINRVGRLRFDADTGRLRLLTVKGWRASLAKARAARR